MKIIVSAGGTGGHLYPALALVEYIKTQDQDGRMAGAKWPDLGNTHGG